MITLQKFCWYNDFHRNDTYLDSKDCPCYFIYTNVWEEKDTQWFLDRGWTIKQKPETLWQSIKCLLTSKL